MKASTEKQKAVLQALSKTAFTSTDEVANALGISSLDTYSFLRNLMRKGLIRQRKRGRKVSWIRID